MKITAIAPATAAAVTAATVQRTLQRRAASTASPARRAAKLDCEKVGTRPTQRTATRAPSSAWSRRPRAHINADITMTSTRAR